MDAELLKYLGTMGIGGTLAAFMFVFYRKDQQACEARWKGQAEMFAQVVKENSAAIAELRTLMRVLLHEQER